MDDDGIYQVGVVSDSGGDEENLTESFDDLEEPDWGSDGSSIFCVRSLGLEGEVGYVDASIGGYTAVTDSEALRDNPDTHYDEVGDAFYVIYERENSPNASFELDGIRPQRQRKTGVGVFLSRVERKRGDGAQSAGTGVLAFDRVLPNPAADRVTVRWQVPTATHVTLKAYDAAGRLVHTLFDGPLRPGGYEATWDGTDDRNRRLPSGIYFCTLEADNTSIKRKVVLTRSD